MPKCDFVVLQWQPQTGKHGFKPDLNLPRSCKMACNHRRRALCGTIGSLTQLNDKTLTDFDKFLSKTHCWKTSDSVVFCLLSWEMTVHSFLFNDDFLFLWIGFFGQ